VGGGVVYPARMRLWSTPQSSMTRNSQISEEIRIFNLFAQICPLPIMASSVRKLFPPAPDIFCKLEDVSARLFELVQVIDSSVARFVNSSSVSYRGAASRGSGCFLHARARNPSCWLSPLGDLPLAKLCHSKKGMVKNEASWC